MFRKFGLLIILHFLITACNVASVNNKIVKTNKGITIDGKADDIDWQSADWQNIDQLWLGPIYDDADFNGRFKLLWDKNQLFILAEIKDDTLVDFHVDGLDKYWNDDCLEIFVDENQSKGNHQYNHNAFAYHIGLDGKVVDIGTDSLPRYYDHVFCKRMSQGQISTWEASIKLYDESFQDGKKSIPQVLKKGKKIGFAVAYCDNDQSLERENFIGSSEVFGEDKDQGWIDAGVFSNYILD